MGDECFWFYIIAIKKTEFGFFKTPLKKAVIFETQNWIFRENNTT